MLPVQDEGAGEGGRRGCAHGLDCEKLMNKLVKESAWLCYSELPRMWRADYVLHLAGKCCLNLT
jgi:hypothetical protein